MILENLLPIGPILQALAAEDTPCNSCRRDKCKKKFNEKWLGLEKENIKLDSIVTKSKPKNGLVSQVI